MYLVEKVHSDHCVYSCHIFYAIFKRVICLDLPLNTSACLLARKILKLLRTRAENGPKFFGPARPGPSSSGPGPARPVVFAARPGPFRAGIFRELSLKCLCIVFYLFIFYRNICFSGYFYCITYVFIVLSMFRETFRKFS
jgi:hypothetical protein